MQTSNKEDLRNIVTQHLLDARSDQVYQPFRDMTSHVSEKRFILDPSQYKEVSTLSQTSMIPAKLKGLQISNEPIDPFKKFKKVAERQKQYQPIEEGVLKKLFEHKIEPIKTVYKYSQLESRNYKLRTGAVQKIAQNQLNFTQKIDEKLEYIEKTKQKEQSYNLFSFLDEPFHHLRKML